MSDEAGNKSAGVFDGMLEKLISSGQAAKMEGLDIERLKSAMSAPGAAETVMAIQAMGADSQAGVGQAAPDFELPYLPGHGGAEGETVRLSDRFGKRPVALIFGSYT
jgi:hypothetical protein